MSNNKLHKVNRNSSKFRNLNKLKSQRWLQLQEQVLHPSQVDCSLVQTLLANLSSLSNQSNRVSLSVPALHQTQAVLTANLISQSYRAFSVICKVIYNCSEQILNNIKLNLHMHPSHTLKITKIPWICSVLLIEICQKYGTKR